MDKAIHFCKDSGFKEVYLTTFAGLNPAKHVYEKWGFELVEEKEDNTWGVVVRYRFPFQAFYYFLPGRANRLHYDSSV